MHALILPYNRKVSVCFVSVALLLLAQLFPASNGLAAQFDILSYNIYMRPFFHDGQEIRAKLLISRLANYDTVVFQEAYDDHVRDMLRRDLRAHYPFHTRILGADSGLRQDGGVIVLSKWPIVRERQRVFTNGDPSVNRCLGPDCCEGSDCFADKGVLYARIDKQGRCYHVFGTHLQSGREQWQLRNDQFSVISSFIESQHIPDDEPVMIAGDMNVDRNDAARFAEMRQLLEAEQPPLKPASSTKSNAIYTFDGLRNDLNDNEGVRRYVDYVLYATAHLTPDRANNRVRIFRTEQPWRQYFWQRWRRDLSDHYAVHGHFVYSRSLNDSRTCR